MNVRIFDEETPEARLAAVARTLMDLVLANHLSTGRGPRQPDYADFREAFRPFLEREVLVARIDEARRVHGEKLTARVAELGLELKMVDTVIAERNKK